MKHTPGPWFYDEGTASIGCASGRIARVEHTHKGIWEFGDPDADGALMAAAPELLVACKVALDEIEEMSQFVDPRYTATLKTYLETIIKRWNE